MIGLTGRALVDHEPVISAEQYEADRLAFMRTRKPVPGRGRPNAKLTLEEVEEAVRMYEDGASINDCADKFGVRASSMRSLLSRRTKIRSSAEGRRLQIKRAER